MAPNDPRLQPGSSAGTTLGQFGKVVGEVGRDAVKGVDTVAEAGKEAAQNLSEGVQAGQSGAWPTRQTAATPSSSGIDWAKAGIGAAGGGAIGALVGRALAGKKNRDTGTMLGGLGGAALGGYLGTSLGFEDDTAGQLIRYKTPGAVETLHYARRRPNNKELKRSVMDAMRTQRIGEAGRTGAIRWGALGALSGLVASGAGAVMSGRVPPVSHVLGTTAIGSGLGAGLGYLGGRGVAALTIPRGYETEGDEEMVRYEGKSNRGRNIAIGAGVGAAGLAGGAGLARLWQIGKQMKPDASAGDAVRVGLNYLTGAGGGVGAFFKSVPDVLRAQFQDSRGAIHYGEPRGLHYQVAGDQVVVYEANEPVFVTTRKSLKR
jgi:hypothetical protein